MSFLTTDIIVEEVSTSGKKKPLPKTREGLSCSVASEALL
jgi:hypothetical protein